MAQGGPQGEMTSQEKDVNIFSTGRLHWGPRGQRVYGARHPGPADHVDPPRGRQSRHGLPSLGTWLPQTGGLQEIPGGLAIS